jgi:hypothetical protein
MLIRSPQYIRLLAESYLEINTSIVLPDKPFLIFKNLEKNRKVTILDYYYNSENQLIIRIYNHNKFKTENARLFSITSDMFELSKGDVLCECVEIGEKT